MESINTTQSVNPNLEIVSDKDRNSIIGFRHISNFEW